MTDLEEAIVRWTVRLSMACYCLFVFTRVGNWFNSQSAARWCWTLGLGFFLLHLLAAFGFYHEWSHANAYAHTADRTLETVGFHWGGGLYFNYLFSLVWLVDVVCWWRIGLDWPNKSRFYQTSLHTFFAFMVLNSTVVFGPQGWWIFAIFFFVTLGVAIKFKKPKRLT